MWTYQVACGLVTLKCCLRGPSLPQPCACWCGHPIFTAKPLNGIIELYNGVTFLTHEQVLRAGVTEWLNVLHVLVQKVVVLRCQSNTCRTLSGCLVLEFLQFLVIVVKLPKWWDWRPCDSTTAARGCCLSFSATFAATFACTSDVFELIDNVNLVETYNIPLLTECMHSLVKKFHSITSGIEDTDVIWMEMNGESSECTEVGN